MTDALFSHPAYQRAVEAGATAAYAVYHAYQDFDEADIELAEWYRNEADAALRAALGALLSQVDKPLHVRLKSISGTDVFLPISEPLFRLRESEEEPKP